MSPSSRLNANNGCESRSIVLRDISHALEIDKAHGNLQTCCKDQLVKRSKYKLKVSLLRLLDKAKIAPRSSFAVHKTSRKILLKHTVFESYAMRVEPHCLDGGLQVIFCQQHAVLARQFQSFQHFPLCSADIDLHVNVNFT